MNNIKFKYPFIFFIGIILFLTIFAFINVASSSSQLNFAALTLYNYPSEESVSNYFETINKILNKNKSLLNLNNDFEIYDFDLANSYLEKLEKADKSFKASTININEFENIKPIEFKFFQKFDDDFPKGYSYVKKGERGANIDYIWEIKYASEIRNLNRNFTVHTSFLPAKDEFIFFGTKDPELLTNNIQSDFQELIIDGSDKTLIYPSDKTKLQNITVDSINFNQAEKIILSNSESLDVGNLNIKLGNCNKSRVLTISYIPQEKTYFFKDFQEFLDGLCIKQFIEQNGYLLGTCTECTLYPIDKTHAIKPDYEPEVLSVDFAPGFQRINKIAFNDFYELYKAAKADKVNIMVTSGYRSYTDQLNTFNYWTSVEMSKGYSRAQAESIANSYSAKPGFSEHQLGTALDLNGAGCDSFNGACTGNQSAWDWLANNAYRFGFVISYPESKQSQTGYIYEPWHYRWIGKELAAEYRKVEKDTYLQKWLFDLGKY